MWVEILTALALVLVIEGLLPFSGPRRYRQFMMQLAQLPDGSIRIVGLCSMLAGLLLLFLVRG